MNDQDASDLGSGVLRAADYFFHWLIDTLEARKVAAQANRDRFQKAEAEINNAPATPAPNLEASAP